MSDGGISCTWLGHAAFRLQCADFVLLIDPWIENPKFPSGFQLDKVHAILISHGHFDHVGNTVELAKKFGAKVYCQFEVSKFLTKEGLPQEQIVDMNKGGCVDIGGGFKATMVNAIHSGACGGAELVVGGDPAGWVISAHNGHVIYHSGDTDVFGDMRIISDLYKPDVALLCIGGHYTMGPQGAAYAIDNLLSTVKIVVPMHWGTFPALAGTPQDLHHAITRRDVNLTRLNPGESFVLAGRSVKDLFE